jgi:hypothetical protein
MPASKGLRFKISMVSYSSTLKTATSLHSAPSTLSASLEAEAEAEAPNEGSFYVSTSRHAAKFCKVSIFEYLLCEGTEERTMKKKSVTLRIKTRNEALRAEKLGGNAFVCSSLH